MTENKRHAAGGEGAPHETQQSIADWADQTFGPVKDPSFLLDRALLEFEELHTAVAAAKQDPAKAQDVGAETADILILLHRLLHEFGLDTNECLNAKMRINRLRQWRAKGDGTGSHIKAKDH